MTIHLPKVNGFDGGNGGNGGKIKVLNVIENGNNIIRKNGNILSNFISTSDYLTLGDFVQDNILNPNFKDKKDFGEIFTDSNNWTLQIAFTYISKSDWQNIVMANSYQTNITAESDGKLSVALYNSSQIAKFGSAFSLTNNTKYYLRLSFTGTKYILSISTDNINYTDIAETLLSTKLDSNNKYIDLAHPVNSDGLFLGDFDMENCCFINNGEIIWKGVETI